jgi:hypothetical protein
VVGRHRRFLTFAELCYYVDVVIDFAISQRKQGLKGTAQNEQPSAGNARWSLTPPPRYAKSSMNGYSFAQ